MQGLILLTYNRWENEEIVYDTIAPQSLLDQKLAELYNAVGMHYYDEKDYEKAVESFDKALQIQEDYAQVYFNKACTQSLKGDKDEAIESLKKAIELEPGKFIEKAKTDKDLDEIRNEKEFLKIIDN